MIEAKLAFFNPHGIRMDLYDNGSGFDIALNRDNARNYMLGIRMDTLTVYDAKSGTGKRVFLSS